jgi:hypothetical protein
MALEFLGSSETMGPTLFDKMRLLRAAGRFDVLRWAADFIHWQRTLRNRVLDAGHVVVIRPGGKVIDRGTIISKMPGAPGVDGPGLDKAAAKFQDAPPIAMHSLGNLVDALASFPNYSRFISPAAVMQGALRLHQLSRSARMILLEMGDAMLTYWMVNDPIAAGGLAQSCRSGDDRAMSFYSHDQLIRGSSVLFAAAYELEAHADVVVDTSRFGTKPLEEHFGSTRHTATIMIGIGSVTWLTHSCRAFSRRTCRCRTSDTAIALRLRARESRRATLRARSKSR